MEELRKEAEKRIKEKKELRGNIATFIVISIVLLYFNFRKGFDRFPWSLIAIGVLAISVVDDIIKFYKPFGSKEDQIEKEMRRLRKAHKEPSQELPSGKNKEKDLDLEEFKQAVESRKKQAKKLWNDQDLV